jgi:hypothetical protein
MAAAVQRGDLSGGAHGYARMSEDAVGEVGGHAGGQVIAVHDQGDGVAVPGEIQRRLGGGVRPADDRDRVRTAGPGLQLRCRGGGPASSPVPARPANPARLASEPGGR